MTSSALLQENVTCGGACAEPCQPPGVFGCTNCQRCYVVHFPGIHDQIRCQWPVVGQTPELFTIPATNFLVVNPTIGTGNPVCGWSGFVPVQIQVRWTDLGGTPHLMTWVAEAHAVLQRTAQSPGMPYTPWSLTINFGYIPATPFALTTVTSVAAPSECPPSTMPASACPQIPPNTNDGRLPSPEMDISPSAGCNANQIGACCYGLGQCTQTTASLCDSIGGIFRGVNVLCADITCPIPWPPPNQNGQCCVPTGGCINTTGTNCAELGGDFHPGKDCATSDIMCPDFPRGACCRLGRCIPNTTESGCNSMGGRWLKGKACTTTLCTGALPSPCYCCINGVCQPQLTQQQCHALQGTCSGYVGCVNPQGQYLCVLQPPTGNIPAPAAINLFASAPPPMTIDSNGDLAGLPPDARTFIDPHGNLRRL